MQRAHPPGSLPDATPEAAGFVLAGGQSSRMGQDKALLSFAGQPLLVRALALLRAAGLPATIAGAPSSSSLAAFAPVLPDPAPGLGPLAGLCTALSAARARHAVFVPIDLPLLPASLLVYLLRHAQLTGRPVTVPSVNGFAQTFPVVLDRAALPALQCELAAGRAGCFAAFRAAAVGLEEPLSVLPVELLAQCGQVQHPAGLPPALWFLNVNTPADLRSAASHAAARIA